ncbi:integrase arm-type DNA-binding domain-containing protein [Acinetobacter sp. YH01005]|uniref:tyrosine-type recombinase/integrase n=1 Tax=Acinetobacter sp. YH01005 TaxID=2601021 RepID=UPI0015D3274E|nr:integrase arm-type DNA-binding domain-containing protein [Acinetobacter sp. YH01005]
MARLVKPLTVTQIESSQPNSKDYTLCDGDGLYLRIRKSGTKTWIFQYKNKQGSRVVVTIGNYPQCKLAFAREKRREYLTLQAEGIDPKEYLEKLESTQSRNYSLESITRTWLDLYAVKKPLDEETKKKRLRKFENHLFPHIGNFQIEDVKPKDLRITLNKIYETSADNAQRIRADLVLIFSYAVQYGYIEVNHAREMESLDLTAPKNHRPALPLLRLPELLARIKADSGDEMTKLCLELSLHIFIRSSELRFARWDEIDFKKKQWIIPAKRNHVNGVKHSDRGAKMREPHIVPLSEQALSLLVKVKQLSSSSELVFPSSFKKTTFICENTFNTALRRMGYDTQKEVCFHGFRAMARSALGECGLFQRDAIEKQMSHQERNDVVGAYTHVAEYMLERKKMMDWWSRYLQDIAVKGFVSPYSYANPEVIPFVRNIA